MALPLRPALALAVALVFAASPAPVRAAEDPAWPDIRTDYREGHFAEALARLERVVAASPQDREAHYYLALIHWRMENFPQAAASWRRVLALDPNGPFGRDAKLWLATYGDQAGLATPRPRGAATPFPLSLGSPTPAPRSTPTPRATLTPFAWPTLAPTPFVWSSPVPTRQPATPPPIPTPLPETSDVPFTWARTPIPLTRPSGFTWAMPSPAATPEVGGTAAPETPTPYATPFTLATARPPVAATASPPTRTTSTAPPRTPWLTAQPERSGGRLRSRNAKPGYFKGLDGTFEFVPPTGFVLLDEGVDGSERRALFGPAATLAGTTESQPPTLLVVWRDMAELKRFKPDQKLARERQLLAIEAATYGPGARLEARFGVPTMRVTQRQGSWAADTWLFFQYDRLYAVTYGGEAAELPKFAPAVTKSLGTPIFYP